MSPNEKVKMWKRWRGKTKTTISGHSTNGTGCVESENEVSPSLAALFDQMVSDVLVSMDEAQADQSDLVEQICTTEQLCCVCRAKRLGDSLSARHADGRDLEGFSDGASD